MGRGKAKATPVREYIPLDPGVEWRHRKTEFNELWSNREIHEIHERIEQKVYAMAKDGIPMSVIADFFGVDREQLANHYHEAWRMGKAELDALAYSKVTSNGLDSNQPVNTIFFSKAITGMSDQRGVTLEIGDTGSDINVNVNVVGAKYGDSTE